MAEIVQPETLSFFDLHSCRHCGRAQMVGDERRGIERQLAFGLHRREYKIRLLGIRRLLPPLLQILSEQRMQRDVPIGSFRLRLSIFSLRPALAYPDAALIPENVRPAQRENLGCAKRGCRAGQHER